MPTLTLLARIKHAIAHGLGLQTLAMWSHERDAQGNTWLGLRCSKCGKLMPPEPRNVRVVPAPTRNVAARSLVPGDVLLFADADRQPTVDGVTCDGDMAIIGFTDGTSSPVVPADRVMRVRMPRVGTRLKRTIP